MLNKTIGSGIDRLGQVIELNFIETFNKKDKEPQCMSYKYDQYIRWMKDIYINSGESYGSKEYMAVLTFFLSQKFEWDDFCNS